VILQKKYLYNDTDSNPNIIIYPPITATAYSYAFGSLCVGIGAIPYGIIFPTHFTSLNYKVLIPLSYAAIINSALCYGLLTYAASLTSASIVTAFWPLQIPVSALMTWFLFHQTLDYPQYIGGALVILGLFFVCWAKYQYDTRTLPNIQNVKTEQQDDISFRTFDAKRPEKEQLINS